MEVVMKKRNAALAAAITGALTAGGILVWAIVSDDSKPSASSEAETITTITTVTEAEPITENLPEATTTKATTAAPEKPAPTPNAKADDKPSGLRKFKVDVLLAPMGFRVEEDYVLEIAKAEDVHSKRDSHLDSTDNIFYSASVINGVTELALADGEYELCIYPEGRPDNFKRYTWTIGKDTTDRDLQLIVTEKVAEGQMMIVLHWGEKPRDIDGYLVGEDDFIYYWGREGKHARLDTDSKKGSGIETITVTDLNGSFKYTVDDYSNEVELGKSGAVVEAFTSEDRNPTIFRVPEGIKEVWDVFTLKDGKLTAINKEGEMICPEKIAAAQDE